MRHTAFPYADKSKRTPCEPVSVKMSFSDAESGYPTQGTRSARSIPKQGSLPFPWHVPPESVISAFMDDLIREVKAYSLVCAEGSRGSHDWEHTRRVHALCLKIGRAEGADLLVLELAAYLHDVGRTAEDEARGGICHAAKGADMARAFLQGKLANNGRLENVLHCIRTHRFRGDSRPETLEARVLFDADKLDAIGAVGIGRAFQFAGEVGATLHNPLADPENTAPYTREDTAYREYRLKLSRIRERMLTAEGRRLAEERHAFMEQFFERFLEEVEGRK